MSVKNDIRSELEAHRGEDISGQYLAEKLGVSLSTVQKELKLIMTICMGVAGRSSKL